MSDAGALWQWFEALGVDAAARLAALEALVPSHPGRVAALRAARVFGDADALPAPEEWLPLSASHRVRAVLAQPPGVLDARLEQAEPLALPVLFDACVIVARYEPERVASLERQMRAAMRRAPSKAPTKFHAQVIEAGLKAHGWKAGESVPEWTRVALREAVAFILEESRSPHMLAVAAHGRLCQKPASGLRDVFHEVLFELARDTGRSRELRAMAAQVT